MLILALLLATQSKAVESTVLVNGEPGLQFVISPKGQHLAAIVLRGSRKVVVHDGVEGPKFDDVLGGAQQGSGPFSWSQDGTRLAYIGRRGQEYVYMVDGKEHLRLPMAERPDHQLHAPLFTPNGKHVYFKVYTAKSGSSLDQWWNLYYDGKPGPDGYSVSDPAFGAGGDRHAYMVESRANRGTYSVAVDGKPSAFPGGNPQWTADGLHLFTSQMIPRSSAIDVFVDGKPFMRSYSPILFTADSGSGVIVVMSSMLPNNAGPGPQSLAAGNKRLPGTDCPTGGGGYDKVWFSRDGMHFAARCTGAGRAFLVVDGKKHLEYAAVDMVNFTSDNRVTYVANQGGKNFVIVGDQESDAWEQVTGISPRSLSEHQEMQAAPTMVFGKRVAYIGLKQQGTRARSVVIDGKATTFDDAANLSFSADGSRYVFTTGMSPPRLVVDGVEQKDIGFAPPMLQVYQGLYAISPDGKHVAHAASRPGDTSPGLALDGKFIAAPGTQRMDRWTFSPDGNHLVWIRQKSGGPNSFIYLDGEQLLELGPMHGMMQYGDASWSMGADGVLTFIAQDGDQMKRFKVNTALGRGLAALAGTREIK